MHSGLFPTNHSIGVIAQNEDDQIHVELVRFVIASKPDLIHTIVERAPGAKPTRKPQSRDALLTAIAKARGWIDDIRLGRIASFAEIAEQEAVGERLEWHVSTSQCQGNPLNHAATGSISQPQHAEYGCSAVHHEFAWQVQERACAKACLNHCVVAPHYS
jgi:hypothetical protein